MDGIEVKTNEYKVVDIKDDTVLYTKDLNYEIACSFFSLRLGKVALGRNLSSDQLLNIFSEINPNNLREQDLIIIRIIGGDESEQSQQYVENLVRQLQTIDKDDDIINIKSFDVGLRIHPNSFELNCYHGGVSAMNYY